MKRMKLEIEEEEINSRLKDGQISASKNTIKKLKAELKERKAEFDKRCKSIKQRKNQPIVQTAIGNDFYNTHISRP